MPDGSPAPPNTTREYVATGQPGERLPHTWPGAEGARRSSLDLVPFDRFTLVSFGEHRRWGEAARGVPNVPVGHVRIGIDAVGSDEWRATYGVGASGALLVRPDQHIARRASSLPGDAAASLRAAVERVARGPA